MFYCGTKLSQEILVWVIVIALMLQNGLAKSLMKNTDSTEFNSDRWKLNSQPKEKYQTSIVISQNTNESIGLVKGRGALSYSYYYLSRRVFYFPLYYLLYFGVYVIWVLVRAVSQHNISPHRSLDSSSKDLVSDLSEKFHQYLSGFRNKYF